MNEADTTNFNQERQEQMTQVMDAPTNGETSLAKPAERPRGIVSDDSQFSMLLDTNRFDHLWRIACLFAKSSLVPVHFQGKSEDCFIACQMAIRLGVDPFMFMQNTYIYQGKPGMEGKLAIALINTSGLFQGPIKYRLDGEGDARGCEAYATLKSDGTVVTGPRVTIKIAKAEGWYGRNKKWESITDLMLQYRSGTWFGRVVCPERLMGMTTIEELRDVDGDGLRPETTRAARRTAALMDKLAPADPDAHPPHDDPGEIIDAETPTAQTTAAINPHEGRNPGEESQASGRTTKAGDSAREEARTVAEAIPQSPESDTREPEAPEIDPDAYPANCPLDQIHALAARVMEDLDAQEAEKRFDGWLVLASKGSTPAERWNRLASPKKQAAWKSVLAKDAGIFSPI